MMQKQLVFDPKRKEYVETYVNRGPSKAIPAHGRSSRVVRGVAVGATRIVAPGGSS